MMLDRMENKINGKFKCEEEKKVFAALCGMDIMCVKSVLLEYNAME